MINSISFRVNGAPKARLTWLVKFGCRRHQQWQRSFNHFITVLVLPLYNRLLRGLVYGKFTSIGSLRHTEFLCDLRTHLCCIAIDSLFTAENELELTVHGSLNMTNSGCNRIACSQCISAAKGTICYEHRIISA